MCRNEATKAIRGVSSRQADGAWMGGAVSGSLERLERVERVERRSGLDERGGGPWEGLGSGQPRAEYFGWVA